MRRIRNRLTYANVMSTIAVFCALGGGTFALAAALKKDSVGTKQIATNAVKEAELAKNAVTQKKIASGAVTDAKLGAISLTGDELADGSVSTGKLADGAVTTAKVADNAISGAKVNEATLGEVPSAAVATKANNVLFASVNADGTLASQSQPTVSVVKSAVIPGQYTLNFSRNLADCSAVASVGANSGSAAVPNDASAGASIGTLGNISDVIVQTRDLAGADEDNNFQVIVTC